MHKKTICVAIVSFAAIALLPGISLAYNRGGNHGSDYRGNDFGNNYSNYYPANDHGGKYLYGNNDRYVRVIEDNSHRNAAAYPSYIPSNYYGNCNYNYGYGYGNNCYQTGQNYYYNPVTYCPQTAVANCPCQNQYYQNHTPAYYRAY